MTDLSHHTREMRRDAALDVGGLRDAVRTGLGFAVAALVVYVLASTWVGTCTGSLANAAGCGAPQQAMMGLGAPAILFAGGMWSLTRGARAQRDHMVWFGAGSVLLALMVVSVVATLPSLPV